MFPGISLVILNNLSISKVKRRKMICEIVNIVNRIFFINVAILVLYCCEKIMTMATLIKENIYLVLAYSSTQRLQLNSKVYFLFIMVRSMVARSQM